MKKINVLVTGGAGFIGSNLVKSFLYDDRIGIVRVLDNLSNGSLDNLSEFESLPRFEFIEGDIRDYELLLRTMVNIDIVSHQAALGSVPRSIVNPRLSTEVNILGTVNVLQAGVESKVRRVILAFSSSTYGDHPDLPKEEHKIGIPLSPYAASKASIEQFCDVFGKTYDLEWIGLRYFNVFGPKQSPDNPYAAVIPIFTNAIIKGTSITINGDGKTSRDFTYVDNIVKMNLLAMFTKNTKAVNQIYNAACGEQTSLNKVISLIKDITGKRCNINYATERVGDVKHSLASIDKAQKLLHYFPETFINEGLEKVIKWYEKKI